MKITAKNIELNAQEIESFTSQELYIIFGLDPSEPRGEPEMSFQESEEIMTIISGDFFNTTTEEDNEVFYSAAESITQQKFVDNEPTVVGRRLPRCTSSYN